MTDEPNRAIAEVWEVARESRESRGLTDGRPISYRTARRAETLIRSLPAEVPMPEAAWEPDGHLAGLDLLA